jgi:exonuclease III
MGVNMDLFDVQNWIIRVFWVSYIFVSKRDGFRGSITTVYGVADEERKQRFIYELHSIFVNMNGPALIGGDFNLVRFQTDKSNGLVDFKWCDRFNEWVDKHCLLKINLAGRNFTWTNNQENPIYSYIDIIFCSTEFDEKFPLANAKALPRNPSDHVPIMWESGQGQMQKKPRFKFENWWI